MNTRSSIFVVLILLANCMQTVFAIRANPSPVVVTQPDGTMLTIRIHGDEFGHFRTTNDGYLISQNEKGYYIYNLSNSTITDKTVQIVARDISKRSVSDQRLLLSVPKADVTALFSSKAQPVKSSGIQRSTTLRKAFPVTGTPKSLVILVNFSDKSYVVPTPQTAFTNLLNQSGYSANGGTGSARDYFMAASLGKFAPQFDVVGPYTLPNTLDYYGENDASKNDKNPQQMIIDACTQANANGVDFTQYDTDNDGMVDNIFVYYAGYNEAEGGAANTIWPHRWSLANFNNKFDDKIVYDYACTSELNSNSGSNMCGIGTFSHEFGHVLGLPDYYHTADASGNKSSLDYWHIMDAGAYNNKGRTPPTYTAYDRFYLGWFTPQEINTANNYTLLPLYQGTTTPANTDQQAYILSAATHNLNGVNPSPSEFFMVEYRKKTGWDAYLPGEGMLIWHVDYDANAWADNSPNNYTGSSQTYASHMRMYLQPLRGNTATPGAAFSSGYFVPIFWDGTYLKREITDIVKTANNLTFNLMGGLPVDPMAKVIKPGIVDNSLTFMPTKIATQRIKTINIKTTDIAGNLTVAITGPNAGLFAVSVASVLKDAANTFSGVNVTVYYRPTAVGSHIATLTISGGGLNPAKVITLSGEGK
jgi:M6 family metalloprotease-like protein